MLKHNMDVSNFLSTLNPKDLIDWIGELEDYFELEDMVIQLEWGWNKLIQKDILFLGRKNYKEIERRKVR